MIDTINFLSSAMENSQVSTLIAADTSRAFDSIEHVRLLDKLGWYGVDKHWFEDWLRQGRSQGGVKGAMAPPWSPKGPPSRCQKYGEGHNKGNVSIMRYKKTCE